jgi:hypothetical protein
MDNFSFDFQRENALESLVKRNRKIDFLEFMTGTLPLDSGRKWSWEKPSKWVTTHKAESTQNQDNAL